MALFRQIIERQIVLGGRMDPRLLSGEVLEALVVGARFRLRALPNPLRKGTEFLLKGPDVFV